MPSAKYTFLTVRDEQALTQALREKFPGIRFADRSGGVEPEWNEIESLDATEGRKAMIVLAPPRWKPRFEEWNFSDRPLYRVANYPDEVLIHMRSYSVVLGQKYGRDLGERFHAGRLQAGVTNTMNRAQRSFANKVWRLLGTIGSYRFRVHYWVDGKPTEREWDGKRYFAGNDAIRWALEDENRSFELLGSGYLRPID